MCFYLRAFGNVVFDYSFETKIALEQCHLYELTFQQIIFTLEVLKFSNTAKGVS